VTAVPVCRFFGTPGKGPNSHFYTADANECVVVKQNPGSTFEAIAFSIEVAQAGACKAGTTPVYRSFYPEPTSRSRTTVFFRT
jgi:serine protease